MKTFLNSGFRVWSVFQSLSDFAMSWEPHRYVARDGKTATLDRKIGGVGKEGKELMEVENQEEKAKIRKVLSLCPCEKVGLAHRYRP